MDRRVVAGLAGLLLAGVAEACQAQNPLGRDPSAQRSVTLAPIPSIGDSINNTSVYNASVPMAPSGAPTSPVGLGPEAILPKVPVGHGPVSMTPLEPIQRSISRGFGTGLFSSMFRKPAERGPAPILRSPPRVEPSSRLSAGSTGPEPPTIPAPSLRPAPFAGRSPQAPRAQADSPAGSPPDRPEGRPAPFAEDRPRATRPRASAANPPTDRPTPAEPAPVLPATETVRPEPEPILPAPEPVRPGPEPVLPAPVLPEPASPDPAPPPLELPSPPPLEAVPAPTPLEGPGPVPSEPPPPLEPTIPAEPVPGPAPAPLPGPLPPVDPDVSRTGQDEVALRTGPVKPRPLPYASVRAAAVGDEIITINELAAAVTDELKERTGGQAAGMSDDELYQLKNMIASSILNRMIDQALVIQQAKRTMLKNPKAKQIFDEICDKEWTTKELPPLLRNTASTNVHELRVKLTSEGKSYDSMREAYRKKMMFNEFLRSEIRHKVNADMIQMKAYYNDHLDKFEQPARMTWREVEVSIARHPSPAAARQKAEEALARLLHAEDFAAVARSVSNGPTATKGGLYVDMQPGSYGIPVVNDELNRIPTGQVSQILEAPGSFHIIRVDSRRDKGPLRFDEVQDKIRGQVLEQNFQKAVEDYLAKLRARTLIRTMFDNTASDPELARRNDPSVRQASGGK